MTYSMVEWVENDGLGRLIASFIADVEAYLAKWAAFEEEHGR